MTYVEIWTDGSGTTRGNPGGWAYVMEYVRSSRPGDRVYKEGFGGAADATNNRMELSAPLAALRALKRPCTVVITTDSEYVCNAFRQDWISKWKRRKWIKVKNADLWQALIRETEKHDVRWHWVRGHDGDKHNERCDVLAGAARRAIIDSLETDTMELLEFDLDDAELHEQLEMVPAPATHGATDD